MHKTELKVLIEALRILANDIQSQDGVANACVYEASERLSEQGKQINSLMQTIESQKQTEGALIKRCDMLLEALKNFISGYHDVAADAGYHFPEDEVCVIEAREAIAKCEKGEEDE